MSEPAIYEGLALIADPIHSYISFTVPVKGVKEKTEKDLIDSPWMQRLRYIYQLQSARWVYPSAEHSRFQHSLGAMHIAGRFARHLYPTLKDIVKDCPAEAISTGAISSGTVSPGAIPSAPFIEELLRVSALLHDIGHGPFGHFFDDNILNEFEETHETVGQRIIRDKLGDIIKDIRRSPNGEFEPGERIEPDHVAFLIGKGPNKDPGRYPRWLLFLQPLLSGIYTVDNMDYVLRDSYMCGVAIGPVDIDRLIHYSFFTERGLTLHRAGLSALNMFLNARLYMYTNVYYHRTTRAIDLHLKEIFKETIKMLFPYNPVKRLDKYLSLTDWSLLETVRGWRISGTSPRNKKIKRLYPEWQRILGRDVKWKMAYDRTLSIKEVEKGRRFINPGELEDEIRVHLPPGIKDIPFKVDMASQDPRPLNPLMMGDRQIYVYNPSSGDVSKEALKEFFDYIPAKVVLCRIFALNHQNDPLVASAANKVLLFEGESIKTNV